MIGSSREDGPLGDDHQSQVRRALAADGGGDLRAQQATHGLEAGFDLTPLDAIGCDEGHEQRAATDFGFDLEHPQAIEVGIGQFAGQHQIDAFVRLPAQLRQFAIGAAGRGLELRVKGLRVGRPTAVAPTGLG